MSLESFVVVTARGNYFCGTACSVEVGPGDGESYYSVPVFSPEWERARVFGTRRAAERAASQWQYRDGDLVVVGGPSEPKETFFDWLPAVEDASRWAQWPPLPVGDSWVWQKVSS
jgi:hypothetical protein